MFRGSGSTSPTNFIKFLDGDIDITYSIDIDMLGVTACSGTLTLTGFPLPTDAWVAIALYLDGASSQLVIQGAIHGVTGVTTCSTPLSFTFLPKT